MSKWKSLPDLPDAKGEAGVYAGVIGDTLIVAGGSNFPDAPPWRGGTKAYSAKIYLLDLLDPSAQWRTAEMKLPVAAAYGVSASMDNALLLVGGCSAEKCLDSALRITLDAKRGVSIESLPPMPRGLAYMTGAHARKRLFVAGGQESVDHPGSSNAFFMLDLSKKSGPAWEELPAVPGPKRALGDGVAIGDGEGVSFLIFSGRCVTPGAPTLPLKDAYRFDVATRKWTALPEMPRCMMAGFAIGDGRGGALIFGGDSAEIFMKLEELRTQQALASPAERESFQRAIIGLLEDHPGFLKSVARFDAKSNSHEEFGDMPMPAPVTTTGVVWKSKLIIPCGEVRPGIRTAKVWMYDLGN